MAKRVLSRCSRLVVIGYSLPRTDTHIEGLLRAGLAGHELERLVVVNPDRAAGERVMEVVPAYRVSKVYRDLPAYLTQERMGLGRRDRQPD